MTAIRAGSDKSNKSYDDNNNKIEYEAKYPTHKIIYLRHRSSFEDLGGLDRARGREHVLLGCEVVNADLGRVVLEVVAEFDPVRHQSADAAAFFSFGHPLTEISA